MSTTEMNEDIVLDEEVNEGTDGEVSEDTTQGENQDDVQDEIVEDIIDSNVTYYTELYDSVFDKIKDYDFYNMSYEETCDILSAYIRPAVIRFDICKTDLSMRDEEKFLNKLNDIEFEIISNYMVVLYLDSNYLRVPNLLKPMLSNKEFNEFSPANHLAKVTDVRNMYQKENDGLRMRYSLRRKSLELKENNERVR